MRKISYRQALNEAMTQEMERDPSVFAYGIGIPDHKGVWGSTLGLQERFGEDRCFDTPLSEDAMTGFGLGAAISGLRPIHIHIRVDFMLLALNQLANTISSYHYGSGGQLNVPMTIRAVVGRGWGQSYQHSKSMYSVFAHIPGLKVVIPTTPRDAKGLLIAAIRDDNPVLVFEHRWLYDIEDDVPEEPFEIPIGKSNVIRSGCDVTVIAISWMNIEALKAAEILEKYHRVEIEIIDPRSVSPMDYEPMISSVKKTHLCIIADYDWLPCGLSAEIAAEIGQKCFNYLLKPIERLGFAFSPCPCTRPLENQFYPNAMDIVRKVEQSLELLPADLSKEEFYTYEKRFKGPF